MATARFVGRSTSSPLSLGPSTSSTPPIAFRREDPCFSHLRTLPSSSRLSSRPVHAVRERDENTPPGFTANYEKAMTMAQVCRQLHRCMADWLHAWVLSYHF